jgi:alkanesulfonate monooxygenase SsuD/methylene tetrahydromethanopterin reductase-like flavin-dependent oxidoreductase (luciferase family)
LRLHPIFAPEYLVQALHLYREAFTPRATLREPYAMAGVPVIVATTDAEGLSGSHPQSIGGAEAAAGESMDGLWNERNREQYACKTPHLSIFFVFWRAVNKRKPEVLITYISSIERHAAVCIGLLRGVGSGIRQAARAEQNSCLQLAAPPMAHASLGSVPESIPISRVRRHAKLITCKGPPPPALRPEY